MAKKGRRVGHTCKEEECRVVVRPEQVLWLHHRQVLRRSLCLSGIVRSGAKTRRRLLRGHAADDSHSTGVLAFLHHAN